MDYATLEYLLAATQLVLVTLGMGVQLRVADFGSVLGAPRGLVLVFIGQLVLTPLIALAIDAIFGLPRGFALGMVLIAAMPAGTLASLIVYFGRGHIPLAIAATGLTTLASLLTTTAVWRVFGGGLMAGMELPLDGMIVDVIVGLSVCLLMPLVFAMWLARVAPGGSRRLGKWCMRACAVPLTALVIGSLISGRLQIASYGWGPPAALVAFAVAIFSICSLAGRAAALDRRQSFTVGTLSTLRSGNLALFLNAKLFPAGVLDPVGDAVLFVILFYSGASIVVSLGTMLIRRAAIAAASPPTPPHPTRGRLARIEAHDKGSQP
jgi:BASS family bile acid:Na+ symporter